VRLSIGSGRTLYTGVIAMGAGVDTRVHNASFCHRHNFQWNVCLIFVSIQRRPLPPHPPSLNTPSSPLNLRLDPSLIFVIECRRFLTERARHKRGGCSEHCAPAPAIARDGTTSLGNYRGGQELVTIQLCPKMRLRRKVTRLAMSSPTEVSHESDWE